MPLPIIAPVIIPEEYDAFAAMLKDDAEFPATYSGWLEDFAQNNAKCIARGDVLNEVIIHPQDFSDYCRGCGQNPSFTMLGLAAIYKAQRKE